LRTAPERLILNLRGDWTKAAGPCASMPRGHQFREGRPKAASQLRDPIPFALAFPNRAGARQDISGPDHRRSELESVYLRHQPSTLFDPLWEVRAGAESSTHLLLGSQLWYYIFYGKVK
jgi:hypothetical protein